MCNRLTREDRHHPQFAVGVERKTQDRYVFLSKPLSLSLSSPLSSPLSVSVLDIPYTRGMHVFSCKSIHTACMTNCNPWKRCVVWLMNCLCSYLILCVLMWYVFPSFVIIKACADMGFDPEGDGDSRTWLACTSFLGNWNGSYQSAPYSIVLEITGHNRAKRRSITQGMRRLEQRQSLRWRRIKQTCTAVIKHPGLFIGYFMGTLKSFESAMRLSLLY